jgi:hypothetical protein
MAGPRVPRDGEAAMRTPIAAVALLTMTLAAALPAGGNHPTADGLVAVITFDDATHAPGATILAPAEGATTITARVEVWKDFEGDFTYVRYHTSRLGFAMYFGDLDTTQGPHWNHSKAAFRGGIQTNATGEGSITIPISKLRTFLEQGTGNAFAVSVVDNEDCIPQLGCPTSYHSYTTAALVRAGHQPLADLSEVWDPVTNARWTMTPLMVVLAPEAPKPPLPPLPIA